MRYNKIIVEGVDGAGKSTFADRLSKEINFDIIQGSSFEIAAKGVDYMYQHMDNLLDMERVIIDRFYLSNYIYARLFDKKKLSNKQIVNLTQKSLDKTITILLLPSYDLIVNRLRVRGDEYVETKDVRQILDKYNDLLINKETQSFLGNMLIAEYGNDEEANTELDRMVERIKKLTKE